MVEAIRDQWVIVAAAIGVVHRRRLALRDPAIRHSATERTMRNFEIHGA